MRLGLVCSIDLLSPEYSLLRYRWNVKTRVTEMQWSEYVGTVLRLESRPTDEVIDRIECHARELHGVLGLVTELAELEQSSDPLNFAEEVGDLWWYVALLADCYGLHDQMECVIVSDIPRDAAMQALRTNVGELANVYKARFFYGREINWCAAREYFGAIVLSLTAICPPSDCWSANAAKLITRYGDKFSEHRANNRNLDAEAQALDEGFGDLVAF